MNNKVDIKCPKILESGIRAHMQNTDYSKRFQQSGRHQTITCHESMKEARRRRVGGLISCPHGEGSKFIFLSSNYGRGDLKHSMEFEKILLNILCMFQFVVLVAFSQEQTLRQGLSCKQFIRKLVPGDTRRGGDNKEWQPNKGLQLSSSLRRAQGVSKAHLRVISTRT